MTKNLTLFATMFFVLFSIGCSGKRILNYVDRKIPAGMELKDIKSTLEKTVQSRRWDVIKSEDKKLIAEINSRGLMAQVRIDYSETNYSITYSDSAGLSYSGDNIHKRYNKWVKQLARTIDRDLKRTSRRSNK